MIKGGNRRMFRKPGRARQAIGILASSKELMDAAQAGQEMPTEPVQYFNGGGGVNSIYSELDLYGGVAPGFEKVGEGDDATIQPIGGLEGSLARLYGMRDPLRVRSESGFDLLELGARIAAGQSDSTTQNIANALIPTIDKIGKRREKNLATDLAVAQMKDKKQAEQDALDAQLMNRRLKANLPHDDSLRVIGASVTSSGLINYKGKGYSDLTALLSSEELDPKDKEKFLAESVKSKGDVSERYAQRTLDVEGTSAEEFLAYALAENQPKSELEYREYVKNVEAGMNSRGFRKIKRKGSNQVVFVNTRTMEVFTPRGVALHISDPKKAKVVLEATIKKFGLPIEN